MAERLMRYYQYVADKAGVLGKTKLAISTKTPSTKAALEPDTPEMIRKFKDAVREITGGIPPDY